MLPILEGVIQRRVLLNFRCDPEVAQRAIPRPLEVVLQNGSAIVGVCLIRLAHLRPKGVPSFVGLASENMAHRIAIRFPTPEGWKEGVFIWRRETDQALVALLGGRLFPGAHRRAAFEVQENGEQLGMKVNTEDGKANVVFSAATQLNWQSTPAFPDFDTVCEFFRRGDCGFSCSLDGATLEGMQLRTLKWEMLPLGIESVHAAFFDQSDLFPRGSVKFDCGVLMRGIPHEWHELSAVPELASVMKEGAQ